MTRISRYVFEILNSNHSVRWNCAYVFHCAITKSISFTQQELSLALAIFTLLTNYIFNFIASDQLCKILQLCKYSTVVYSSDFNWHVYYCKIAKFYLPTAIPFASSVLNSSIRTGGHFSKNFARSLILVRLSNNACNLFCLN